MVARPATAPTSTPENDGRPLCRHSQNIHTSMAIDPASIVLVKA